MLLDDKLSIVHSREDAEILVPPNQLRLVHDEIVGELKALDDAEQRSYSLIACAGYGCPNINWDDNGLFFAGRVRRTTLVSYQRTRDRLSRAIARRGAPLPAFEVLDSLARTYPEWKY